MPNEITSKQNPIIKNLIKNLSDKKNNLICIDSINLFEEIISNNQTVEYIFCTQQWFEENEDRILKWDRVTFIVTKDILEKISTNKSVQPALFILKVELKSFDIDKNESYIILDNISDPGNMGTILRTAVSFGFKKIYISKNSVDILNPKVVKSSMNAINHISLNQYTDLTQLVQELESNQINVYATALSNEAIPLSDVTFNLPAALIFGNEANGINNNDLKNIKNKIFIEIENLQSLNVSCASSVVMYLLSQRLKAWKK
ncbi:MAG: TrmH family RNA methyltransferase [Mycoplasma sp.]